MHLCTNNFPGITNSCVSSNYFVQLQIVARQSAFLERISWVFVLIVARIKMTFARKLYKRSWKCGTRAKILQFPQEKEKVGEENIFSLGNYTWAYKVCFRGITLNNIFAFEILIFQDNIWHILRFVSDKAIWKSGQRRGQVENGQRNIRQLHNERIIIAVTCKSISFYLYRRKQKWFTNKINNDVLCFFSLINIIATWRTRIRPHVQKHSGLGMS